jgi:GrpB-like predicted nucleotidyltransferase (UPF0157 family)
MQTEWFDRPRGDPPAVEEPDPAWAARAAEWIERLSDALAPLDVRIEHIGSTAVAGLAAKPVIDLQVAVPELQNETAYRPALEALGLVLRAREQDRCFFRPPAEEPRTVHVHVCQRDSDCDRQHVLFRDFLRAHPRWAGEYAELKRRLSEEAAGDRLAYLEGKVPFIERALSEAETWVRSRG